jgi:hypothetical protein
VDTGTLAKAIGDAIEVVFNLKCEFASFSLFLFVKNEVLALKLKKGQSEMHPWKLSLAKKVMFGNKQKGKGKIFLNYQFHIYSILN